MSKHLIIMGSALCIQPEFRRTIKSTADMSDRVRPPLGHSES